MNTNIEEVVEFFTARPDLIEVANGTKPSKFLRELTPDEAFSVLYLIRLRYVLTAMDEDGY